MTLKESENLEINSKEKTEMKDFLNKNKIKSGKIYKRQRWLKSKLTGKS